MKRIGVELSIYKRVRDHVHVRKRLVPKLLLAIQNHKTDSLLSLLDISLLPAYFSGDSSATFSAISPTISN